MKEVKIGEGQYLDYSVKKGKLALGDDELTINLAKYEQDDAVHIDVCRDKFGALVMGVIPNLAEAYVAQVDIPARRYTEQLSTAPVAEGEEGPGMERVAEEFDQELCVITLWPIN